MTYSRHVREKSAAERGLGIVIDANGFDGAHPLAAICRADHGDVAADRTQRVRFTAHSSVEAVGHIFDQEQGSKGMFSHSPTSPSAIADQLTSRV